MSHLFEKINNGGVYVICEMSANHGGRLENALEIVRKAKEIGADCLKIQTYTADTITINCNKPDFVIHGGLWDGRVLYDLYKEAFTPWEWQPKIKEECDKVGIDFLSTPFDNTAVDFLEEMGCDSYKIASFELVDIPLIEYTASKGKPMIISCGMGSEKEIQEAVDACKRVGNDKIVLLKCCSEYPANWKDMHLANIPDMIQKYNVPVGLSDHSEGDLAAILAVGMGACVIEKHMKMPGIESADSGFSMSCDDFEKMIKDIHDAVEIRGTIYYGPSPLEKGNCSLRRSLFAVKDIKKGDKFTSENVRSIRPGTGLKPKYYKELLNKTAKRNIGYGDRITLEDLV